MHEDVFCIDVDIVGIMDIYHISSPMERLTQQSRNDFACQVCLAICISYLFCPHPLGPRSISEYQLTIKARNIEGGVARFVNMCDKRCI